MTDNPGFREGLSVGDERVIREVLVDIQRGLKARHLSQKVSCLILAHGKLTSVLMSMLSKYL